MTTLVRKNPGRVSDGERERAATVRRFRIVRREGAGATIRNFRTVQVADASHALTPGRYVGAEEQEDDGEPFAEKYPRLVADAEECFAEGERLSALIRSALRNEVAHEE